MSYLSPKRRLGVVALAILMWQSTTTWAATQGAVNNTSTGSADVTLTTGLSARLSGLVDFTLGTLDLASGASANQDICVGRSGVGLFANGAYRIRASGDGDPADVHAFTLSNGVDQIYYDVFFNDQGGLTGRTQLTGGVTLPAQQGFGLFEVFNLLFGCVARNANVSIDVSPAQLTGASSGNYAGTLTLVLIPD